jgi:hypothetical protein
VCWHIGVDADLNVRAAVVGIVTTERQVLERNRPVAKRTERHLQRCRHRGIALIQLAWRANDRYQIGGVRQGVIDAAENMCAKGVLQLNANLKVVGDIQ